MAAMGPYDSALQMFVQTPRTVDMGRLTFMRWLAENGRLEHRIAGPSSGPLVVQQDPLKVPDLPAAAA
jgi:hypothetical protein